ncbi:MAG: bifunctional diaminohydroxyphosphoribosylaminopyrimidine deaminase/5-amino-6-(5-phosphoribosylamino)uracil reductase RibD [Candidatus Adiutrix sp.]|jgi:diaminohydroxyphosphoribosylaminopyrimidine deaminase/5-amino-6-(5-phosphoribosylamino)uracil reductase|nr:bifunctional diaminohydroxyphosphoribosylaminopyrimidine deaminase/5-amino-6-(5-phosphoribosylamino)uracil reductase RibD [Candidatus Adiutrix sp.]
MSNWTKEQLEHMKAALRLAWRGRGLVSPNPMVGAVVVRGKKVLATGWHTGPGQPHAEAAALAEAGRKARGADLYVNLEPCNHYGRTGPCTESILRAGIDRVFYGAPDPNAVAAGGARALSEAGVEVHGGLLARECFELNSFFFKWTLTRIPFVIMKTAASLDGRTATSTGQSQWISSKAARNFGHHIRAGVDAIIVGRNTAEKDDPELSARPWGRRKMHHQPWRVLLDPSLKLNPTQMKLFDPDLGGPSLVVCASGAPENKIKKLAAQGHQVLLAPLTDHGLLSIRWVLEELGRQGLQSVLIEPGATLAASALIEEPVVDLVHIFLAPKFIGGVRAPGLIGGGGLAELAEAREAEVLKLGRKGPDIHITVRPRGGFGGAEDCLALYQSAGLSPPDLLA